jgi:molecular chaperone DnaJ
MYVQVRVRPHDRFVRHGDDLLHELHVPVTQAALGAELTYETLDGVEALEIPAGTQTGQVFRLRGRGVPTGRGNRRGDLLVQVVVDTPDARSEAEQDLLRQLAALRGEEIAAPSDGFLKKIRSAFS